jgi:hypothetical protein
MPNLSVAGELLRDGAGRVECCIAADAGAHLKLLFVRHGGDFWLNLGSANFTRRNLDDLNLEAAGTGAHAGKAPRATARAAVDYFAKTWAGRQQRRTGAMRHADYWRYRRVEATGLSSF